MRSIERQLAAIRALSWMRKMGLLARNSNEDIGVSADVTLSMEPAEVIARMSNFSIDNRESSRPFAAVLAHEQSWYPEFTGRAIAEYKRFMVLAAISEKEVTPSEVVDQVWHKHLQYSSNYRDEMCGRVLGKVIDHNPGDGRTSKLRYIDQYVDTLLLYKQTFGEDPPRDIWPLTRAAKGLFNSKTSEAADRGLRTNGVVRADPDTYYLDNTPDAGPAMLWRHSDDVSRQPEQHAGGGGFWGAIRGFFEGDGANHTDGARGDDGPFGGIFGIFGGPDSNDDHGSSCGSSCGGGDGD